MAKKVVLPWELKYDWAIRGYAGIFRGFMYAIREKYGAAAAVEMYERATKMDDRIKRLTLTLLNIFKIEGNDAETIAKFFDTFYALNGTEYTILEQSKTTRRVKVTQCPWKTEPTDISDWALIYHNIMTKTINSKATLERPKAMCAGDPYCEYVWKIEE